MSKRKILYWQIVAVFFTWILGTILHFTYGWSGKNNIVGIFSAINESTWEHLKLSFFPMLIFSIIEGIVLYKNSNNYLEAKSISLFLSIFLITTIFYVYTGILGTNFVIIDILIFFISVLISELVSYRIMVSNNESTLLSKILSILIVIFLFICFLTFTFYTPQVHLFKDPITNEYGIEIKKVESA